METASKQGFQTPVVLARALVPRLADWIFGYDFFLSYSQRDGMTLPRLLKAQLEKEGFHVFLDQTEYVAGVELARETGRQVRKSRKLLLIARPGALVSEWVKREVEITLALGRTPVVLNINQAVETAPNDSYLALLARERDWLLLNESMSDPDGSPSDHLITELVRSFRHTRQETKRLRVVSSVAIVLALAAGVATWQAFEATRQRKVAEQNFEAASVAANGLVEDIARGLRDVDGMTVASVQRILTRAEQTFLKLEQSSPDNPRLLLSKSKMYNEFVETYLAVGDTRSALRAAEVSVAAARKFLGTPGSDLVAPRQLALALMKLGDAQDELGNFEAAAEAHNGALSIRKGILAMREDDNIARRDVGVTLVRLGSLALRRGDQTAARGHFEEALPIRKDLAQREPKWRRDLALNYLVLGDALLELHQVGTADTANEAALTLFEQLKAEDNTSTKAARDVAIAFQRQGNIALKRRDYKAALTSYDKSKQVFLQLAARDRGNVEWQRDIAVADGKRAAAIAASGAHSQARLTMREVVDRRRELVKASPQNNQYRTDLAEALMDLARISGKSGGPAREQARRILLALEAEGGLGREQQAWLQELRKIP